MALFKCTCRIPAFGAGQSPMHVLVVDGDNVFAKGVAHALGKDGHKVLIAADAASALSSIAEHPPALVIVDLMLPGVSGLSLLLALKSDSATIHLPVIGWTATINEDITRQALAFSADAVLVKTRFSMGELRRLAGRFLGREEQKPGGGEECMKRILVVEDDDGAREAVVRLLKDAGYLVMEAENGWEALLALDREPFDLILLDLVMPGMDGRTFLGILRNSEKFRKLKVMVLTAYDVAEMRKLVEPLGVAGIMGKKPPLWDNLLPAVKSAMDAA